MNAEMFLLWADRVIEDRPPRLRAWIVPYATYNELFLWMKEHPLDQRVREVDYGGGQHGLTVMWMPVFKNAGLDMPGYIVEAPW